MSKRGNASVRQVRDWIARGDGQGHGQDYRPFFHVRDVPSRGRSSMVKSMKTARTHHYLGDTEYLVHVLAEFDDNVFEIREQFALLPWEDTQKIARDLEIRHPVYGGTSVPCVMTTDLVLTLHKPDVLVPIACKCHADLSPTDRSVCRRMEKLLIEKEYWRRRSCDLVICTDESIPKVKAKNLDWLRFAVVAPELDALNQLMKAFCTAFLSAWKEGVELRTTLDEVGDRLQKNRADTFALFARSIWLRQLPIDLDTALLDFPYPVRVIGKGESR